MGGALHSTMQKVVVRKTCGRLLKCKSVRQKLSECVCVFV